MSDKHTPWTYYRVGETGFAGGFDVYGVRDSRGTEIACGLTKGQAELIAAAPDLLAENQRLTTRDDALQDRAYCNGAQQALVMAHDSLEAADAWFNAGCGGRREQARAALKDSP